VDFPEPILLKGVPETDASLGSSQRLLAELSDLNVHLKVGTDYPLPWHLEFDKMVADDPWRFEKYVWAFLHWFTKASVSRKLLMAFC
jgi:hypothetical protein